MDLEARFEQFQDDFLEFEKVENKRHPRPDIHAFLMLHELQPKERDMVCSAEHDEIWLDIDTEELALSDEQILELVRCGVRCDGESLCMFV